MRFRQPPNVWCAIRGLGRIGKISYIDTVSHRSSCDKFEEAAQARASAVRWNFEKPLTWER
jgi:hypothetical protein